MSFICKFRSEITVVDKMIVREKKIFKCYKNYKEFKSYRHLIYLESNTSCFIKKRGR